MCLVSTELVGWRGGGGAAGGREGYEVLTIDHEDGTARTDLRQQWDDPAPPHPLLQEDELICSTESVPLHPSHLARPWLLVWSEGSLCKQGLQAHVRPQFGEAM